MSQRIEAHFGTGEFCPDRRDDIVLYIFDEMGPGAAEAFESHLLDCEGCRREVASLTQTLRVMGDAGPATASRAASEGDAPSWEQEWTQLRQRLLSSHPVEEEPRAPLEARNATRSMFLRAAAVLLTAGLAFSAGYLWRGDGAVSTASREPADPRGAPPVAGADNYFDNLDDFTRDTHNFFRRTRMLLMEFSNLGADSDPTFFRESCTELLEEVGRYQEVAKRMQSRKLGDLLDEISGILTQISGINHENQRRVISEVRATLHLTGLVATLELLDAGTERALRGESHV
jgi:hypothetical protein